MFGISYYSPYTSLEYSRPISGALDSMYRQWPKWQTAMDVAQNCMASLSVSGFYKGMAVFIGPDVVLIPKHLIGESNRLVCGANLNALMKSIEVHYTSDQYCYKPVAATKVIEDGGEMDYCLLKLSEQLPCYVPQISFNSNQECLFAEIADSGLRVSIVSQCHGSPGSMCASVTGWTRPGSSGGIYLDMSGQLIGIHLGQSTGLCYGESGQERKILLAKDLAKRSSYLCPLDKAFNPISLPVCLSPTQSNVCYVQQKDVRVPLIKPDKQGYVCESREIHITNAERGIQIDIKQMVQNPKTRKSQTVKVATLSYQIFLVDGGKERANIHNNKGSPSSYSKESAAAFYTHITQMFHANISQFKNESQWPKSFSFTFKKFPFIARSIDP